MASRAYEHSVDNCGRQRTWGAWQPTKTRAVGVCWLFTLKLSWCRKTLFHGQLRSIHFKIYFKCSRPALAVYILGLCPHKSISQVISPSKSWVSTPLILKFEYCSIRVTSACSWLEVWIYVVVVAGLAFVSIFSHLLLFRFCLLISSAHSLLLARFTVIQCIS